MLRLVALALTALLAGCSGLPGFEEYDPDPSQQDCSYPDAQVGGKAFVVGLVADELGEPLGNVTITARSHDNRTTEASTNPAGCYFLDLAPGATYDLRLSKPGYASVERRDVMAQGGEKQVIDFRLQVR